MKRLVPLGLASLAGPALMAPGAATAADVALAPGNLDRRPRAARRPGLPTGT